MIVGYQHRLKYKNEKHRNKLQGRGHLAYERGPHLEWNGNHKQDRNAKKNNEIPAHHNYCKPTGNNPHDRQGYKTTGEQGLVSDGIKIGAQYRFLIQHPGQ